MWDGTSAKSPSARSYPFQSTHPVWDGTPAGGSLRASPQISIHPSRVGWDDVTGIWDQWAPKFQSTHPVWDGTTATWRWRWMTKNFNPPIPCGMGPALCRLCLPANRHFNPPIPCGMGLVRRRCFFGRSAISIHPSRVGWDARAQRTLQST